MSSGDDVTACLLHISVHIFSLSAFLHDELVRSVPGYIAVGGVCHRQEVNLVSLSRHISFNVIKVKANSSGGL